ncbi:hypothetical protein B0H66DRAFT_465900 [Apodospora peruviana]|uniref:Uncharacterized protein n=1 Tax=Apodospora peruviana TaxID=516989 RepID=A0AAE0ISJ6_9PEZI|nr:hypothetical protein B0H66DRAFT_465900 [Apodospora peruviana]
MERNHPDRSDPEPEPALPRPNGRYTSPFVINSASRRRNLFSSSRSKDSAAFETVGPLAQKSATSFDVSSDAKPSSPSTGNHSGTRIPRPSQQRPSQNRQPFSMTDAYKMAKEEEEEAVQGSPSPAPRSWRSKPSPAGSRPQNTLDRTPSDAQRQRRRLSKAASSGPDDTVSSVGSSAAQSLRSEVSESSFDEKLRQHASDQAEAMGDSPQRRSGLPATVPLEYQSPINQSFAWQADADFTAGDLQVSDSPPVISGRSNTKLEEIRALEAEVNERFVESPELRPRNPRLDEIRTREKEVAQTFPDDPAELDEDAESQPSKPESENKFPRIRPTERPSANVDDHRVREIESLSRRALATTRLDEIRERNAGDRSRSASPEIARSRSRELLRSMSPGNDEILRQEREPVIAVEEDKRIAADQVPTVKVSTGVEGLQREPVVQERTRERSEGARPSRGASHTRDDSRDVLRRLALATSTTPSPEPRTGKDDNGLATRDRGGKETATQKKPDRLKSDVKLTVGFAGLRRDSSVDSTSDKRSDFAHSESDPTERIEGEMKLFAPVDNQSERGSLRAPSPELDGEEEEEKATPKTPQQPKTDSMAQPTPRVTGAYVDTPVTVKFEKLESVSVGPAPGSERSEPGAVGTGLDTNVKGNSDTACFPGRKISDSLRKPTSTMSAKGDKAVGRSTSMLTHRRSKSLPRPRSSLVNSARLPTVKDDLLEIQRANHYDDSTLEDLGDLLDAQEQEDVKLRLDVRKLEDSTGVSHGIESDLEAYDRMSKSLQTGLLGIRTAKQGIERLEDKVWHVDAKDRSHTHDLTVSMVCPICHGHSAEGKAALTYVHLPLPRLWHRQPKFRFTLLGFVLFLLSLWYIAESSMCFFYCKPQYCYPGEPCDWSVDDPLWGYSIPVKLDQWLTGGQGRALAGQVGPEVTDWLADAWDIATGTDITQVDTSRYSWDQKRQHRRRLLKRGVAESLAGEGPEDEAKFTAWKAARLARERAESAREMGYDVHDEESMAADEKISGR